MLEAIRQYRSFRIVTGTVVLVIVAFVQSCSELKHAMWATRTTAEVMSVAPSDRGDDYRFVTFVLKDDAGRVVRCKRSISIRNRDIAVGRTVQVEYLPRQPEKARLVDERNLIWPCILAGLIAIAALWVLITWREFHASMR